MAVSLPNGVTFALGMAVTAEKPITAITNASPAVASCTAHGFAASSYLIVKSGWQKLNERIVRVATGSATDSIKLDGIDTTDTNLFPAGGGAGSAASVSSWIQITQVLNASTSGGDMQFANYSFLENDFDSQIPTQASPMSIALEVADDPTLAGYMALKQASDSRKPYAFMATFPSGSKILYYGYVSFNETPTMTKGNVMACKATFSLLSKPVRYAS